MTLGRNDLCWCGSGRKYKKCLLESDQKSRPAQSTPKEAPLPRSHSEEADDFTSVESAMRNKKPEPSPTTGSGLPPEVEREFEQKWLDEHYRKWLDMPLPALDGKAPRQAAGIPSMRAQLIDLLKFIENGEERKRRGGHASYDVSKLKAALGVASDPSPITHNPAPMAY